MFLNSVLKSKKYSYLFNFSTIYLVKTIQNGKKNSEMTKTPANVFSKKYVFTYILKISLAGVFAKQSSQVKVIESKIE